MGEKRGKKKLGRRGVRPSVKTYKVKKAKNSLSSLPGNRGEQFSWGTKTVGEKGGKGKSWVENRDGCKKKEKEKKKSW